jgi:hypothetical protein
MKKLVEIPFNYELIGKEGIVVKFRNGKTCEVFVSKNAIKSNGDYPVVAFDSSGEHDTYTKNGLYLNNHEGDTNDLIMYQEVEVKEPRVIWVNLYPDNSGYVYPTKEDAESIQGIACIGTFKFIEVIEEGE